MTLLLGGSMTMLIGYARVSTQDQNLDLLGRHGVVEARSQLRHLAGFATGR